MLALLALAAATLPWACRSYPGEVPQVGAPRPFVALAGQSQARRVADWPSLPPGPGAEGRPGDFVLENAFVRFVVASADHRGPGRPAGNLIDAAVQRGEDRMRLLAPLLGPAPGQKPICTSVAVEEPGGLDAAAVLVAEGHLLARPEVGVTTTYRLEPGSRQIEVATAVRNRSADMLPLFGFGDLLYHGRTLRFAPGAGLMPAGREGSSTWMSFFWAGRVWGILCAPLDSMDAVYRP
ncbi:MAG: hypothetical protein ACYS8K_08115, partial [Planctomycetota bacterium]